MTTNFLIPDLERDEGFRTMAYQDTNGLWTIGYGHHTDHVGAGMTITPMAAYQQLLADIATTERLMSASPALRWWTQLDGLRQDVLVNQAFNLGVGGLATFDTYLAFVKSGQYAQAADDELHTLWAKQVGKRAVRLANQMRTGEHV